MDLRELKTMATGQLVQVASNFDVTGAGDTVSAVFTLSMAVGASPREAATLANFAAGIVVAEVGTVAVSRDELREALLEAE